MKTTDLIFYLNTTKIAQKKYKASNGSTSVKQYVQKTFI